MASKESNTGDSNPGLTRRDIGAAVAGVLVASTQASSQTPSPAAAANPGPVLDIADWSYSWYGVEHATLARGTVCNGMQMYVEHWIPAQVRHPYPVILIYGGFRQGEIWIGTPDGRRGWVSHLLEQGYKVYVVDKPGQGRNSYHPFVHGAFGNNGPNFEGTARNVVASAIHTQWPGKGDPSEPEIAQAVAAQGQPMANNAITQNLWRTRGAMMLDDIGPAVFLTHGDGSVFAWLTAQERPNLVKGIIALEQPANSLGGQTPQQLAKLAKIPIAIVTAEDSQANTSDPGIAASLRQAGCTVEHIRLAEHGVRGNGTLVMMEKNNREALVPILSWMDASLGANATASAAVTARGVNPNQNWESTAVKLADQGSFWVGVQRKKMPYGTIPLGQMFVQYMIPAEKRYRYPVVLMHGGGGQGTYMMGIGGRPGWAHYFVQAGYNVYWLDRPGHGRSPYSPDALGPSHLPNGPPYEEVLQNTSLFNTAQWPGPGGMNDPLIDQFMAGESGTVTDEAFHSDLAWRGGAELLDRIGPSILVNHGFGGFFGWGVADRRPNLVKAILCMETNGNPFAGQLRWGLTAGPMTYDPPVTDPSQFTLVDHTLPPDSPRPLVPSYRLQAEPSRKWKNLQGVPIGWLTGEFGGGGSPVAQVAFLQQAGCTVEMLRLRDHGISGNGNLMLLEKNNHEVFGVIREWLDKKVMPPALA